MFHNRGQSTSCDIIVYKNMEHIFKCINLSEAPTHSPHSPRSPHSPHSPHPQSRHCQILKIGVTRDSPSPDYSLPSSVFFFFSSNSYQLTYFYNNIFNYDLINSQAVRNKKLFHPQRFSGMCKCVLSHPPSSPLLPQSSRCREFFFKQSLKVIECFRKPYVV